MQWLGNNTAGNNGFTLWGMTFFVEAFVQGSIFVLSMNSSAKNPPQRKASERQTVQKPSLPV